MIANRLKEIQDQIRHAEQAYARKAGAVSLLAVSKTKPAQDIAAAYQAGQRHFGENYVQEAINKQQLLGAFDISWHFIGPIQSNKTKLIARHFAWVHSVDSVKIAHRLSGQRPHHLPPLNICLQVNISGEESKSGIALYELPDIYSQISTLPNLIVRGVMAVPAPEEDFAKQRVPYKTLMQVVAGLDEAGLDTFSFGMSGDWVAAIAEGSTMVRIGTALFGARGRHGNKANV
ncbi:MAG: YggS family pyridoxal phosphate-dependent enzyme [Methylovulum sp.]|uniref:YggS family pyridoxal phosphate-dependent enzyme n=1 Tax=Methylovulum sp. TaxID=1916980 RepID=UPI00262A6308|nr:YggS family pyridoxal phosphate-dependent enzyme [Methylovulum sp.]MDD2725024.1 YggS family pyridoxal phosphate-dependent enzyme [Methylovulum sp.]MDD5125417.1 YggS family pyridoxal phosphate-dependent enzyme [Methylovulum sp.]